MSEENEKKQDLSQEEGLPPVASNVLWICRTKKCEGKERYHKVIAHLDAEKAKIECEVCGSKKTYKKKKKKTTGRSRARKKVKTAEEIWRELKEQMTEQTPQPYSMNARFETQMAIQHPKFGLGFVTGANGLKIQVVFEDGEKFLVHNRK
ncbi:MAG: hypothetical protein D6797_01605 [Bdellovibrio sp.]|nr:MAG: hypothetical protein D6797_01605 [Bdellovibrio sp.]